MEPEELVDTHINSNRIAIFSKTWCGYCHSAKQLFDKLGEDYSVLELDEFPDGNEVQNVMASKAGKRTVPQIFINGEHVGGCDDVYDAQRSGRLTKLLNHDEA